MNEEFLKPLLLSTVYRHNSALSFNAISTEIAIRVNTLDPYKMRKIILALLILASFYALSMWAQAPVQIDDVSAIPLAENANQINASFTGGILIVVSIGIGYLAKKIYTIRSLMD